MWAPLSKITIVQRALVLRIRTYYIHRPEDIHCKLDRKKPTGGNENLCVITDSG